MSIPHSNMDGVWDSQGFSIQALKDHGLFQEDEATRNSMKQDHEGNLSKKEKSIQASCAHGRMDTLANALKTGELNFSEIFQEVRKIAFAYREVSERQKALTQLKTWYDEAKKSCEAYEMADRDVVDLMSSALSKVPRDKYLIILANCRQKRLDLIRKRNEVIDVEKIVNDERSKKAGVIADFNREDDDSDASDEKFNQTQDDMNKKVTREITLPKRFENESTSF
jgi:hypothetical protein